MHYYLFTLVVAAPMLCIAALQSYLGTCAIQPTWKAENKLTIVPLNETARTGLIDPVLEEVGNRFANEFYANISHDGKPGSCFKCLSTIYKESPCVYRAIKAHRFLPELLQCGVRKADICKCVDCLPKVLEQFVKPFCGSKTPSEPEKQVISAADFVRVGKYDLAIQGYRGDLMKYHVEEVKNLGCIVGSSCGSCSCCIGACVHVPLDDYVCAGASNS
ncbi:hypothetical protein QBC46DRAFT_412697 [Diplogelasinospora grovesii]|uniref:Uncharacterized protein n=1 Tax=Diplogelasinospora grovesii TaxID=303347 RepID=A0AAN6MYC9_9PEZI|nr:hypothetical protein QBC46DRAFT_412697 [Diplogelasinospora grovesii]